MEGAILTLHVTTETHFTSEKPKKIYHGWSCQSVCGALIFLFAGVFVPFDTRLCGRVVGVPVGADFDFEIVNFPFLRSLFLSTHSFSRAYSHVVDFNTCNKL